MAEAPYKYWAFISYSHRDRAWAEWLHRDLERYRVPRRLVGRPGSAGPIPARLFPVFRDTEELPSSSNLNGVIDEALRQSRYLIVIASPHAAVSRWVDEEIQRFQALGRADRILCLIVDGEPHADSRPAAGLLECFPPSLRRPGCGEPVGADVRPRKDSRAAAKQRLIAGLLGVGLDELRRRELRRRRLQTMAWGMAAVAVAFVLSGIWQVQQAGKQAALSQQALHAQIRTLYEKGRQELHARNEARAAVYLNEAYRLGLDTPALRFMLGRAMRVVDAERFSIDIGAPAIGVAFSPDGEQLLTIDQERHAAIWDVAKRERHAGFNLPAGVNPAASFSGDGRRIKFRVGNGAPPRLLVFNAADGARLAEVETAEDSYPAQTQMDADGRFLAYVQPGGGAAIYDLDAGRVARVVQPDCLVAGYSRDGRWFLTGDRSGTLRVYDANGLRLRRRFEPLGAGVVYIDSSPDGSLLAAGAVNGAFRLWEADSGRTRISAAHASRYIGHVFNATDGSRLLTASLDSARVWNTRTGALLASIKFPSNDRSIHISHDGRRLINTGNTHLDVLDVDTGVDLYSLDAHFGGATALDFSRDDRWLATGGHDGIVAFWQLPPMPMASFDHGQAPEDASSNLPAAVISGFSASGALGFSAGSDGRVEWWDSRSMQVRQKLDAAFGAVTAGAFSADESMLAVGGTGVLQVRRVGDGGLVAAMRDFGRIVRAIGFSRDGGLVAGALAGGEVRVWQLPDGRLLKNMPIDRYLAAAFSPLASLFATGRDGAVSVWNINNEFPLWSTPLHGLPGRPGAAAGEAEPITALDFDREGKRLLAVSDGGEILVLDAADGHVLLHAKDETSESTTTARFSPDGSSVLISDDNRCAFLLHLGDLGAHHLCGHGSDLASAGFSRDGALIFTAGRDGTAKIWDTDGNLLDSIGFHDGAIAYRTTSFNDRGDRLLTGATDGTARIWDTSPERRDPAQVQASLNCRVPWRADGDEIVSIRPEPGRCQFP